MKKWVEDFLELGFLALLLSILFHYAYNLFLIFTHEEITIYEPNKIIVGVEFFLDIVAIVYVTYRIIKKW